MTCTEPFCSGQGWEALPSCLSTCLPVVLGNPNSRKFLFFSCFVEMSAAFPGLVGGALRRCGPAGHPAEAVPSPWTGGKGVSAAGTLRLQGRKALAGEGQSALEAECPRDTGEGTEPGVTYPGAGGDCDPHAGSCGSQLGSGFLTHSWAWAAASRLLGVPSHPEPQQKLAAYLGQGSGPHPAISRAAGRDFLSEAACVQPGPEGQMLGRDGVCCLGQRTRRAGLGWGGRVCNHFFFFI